MLVVVGLAGGQFTLPVKVKAHGLQLGAHLPNVRFGPALGCHVALDCCVLCGQAEGVPANRTKHAIATLPVKARQDVTDCVDSQMAHVNLPRRVRELTQAVNFVIIAFLL